MDSVKVMTMDKGPYIVSGPIELVDPEGNRWETKEQTALCRCGGSHTKPFCDGYHEKAGFGDCARAKKIL